MKDLVLKGIKDEYSRLIKEAIASGKRHKGDVIAKAEFERMFKVNIDLLRGNAATDAMMQAVSIVDGDIRKCFTEAYTDNGLTVGE